MRELLKLNPYFKKYPLLLLGGVIFIFFTNVFAVFAPALIGEGVNALRDADEIFLDPLRSGMAEADVFEAAPEISYPGTLSKLQSWSGALLEAPKKADSKQDVLNWMGRIAALQALLFLFAYLIKGTFLFFTRQTIIVMSRRIEFDLKGKIFDQYQRLDAAFYRANDTGDLMNRISEDVSKVRMYLGPAIMYTINLAMLIILVVSVMVYIDWKLTLFALLPLPLMSLAIYFVSTRINVQSESVQKKQSGLSTFVQQHIAGIRVLKSFQREKDASQRFAGIADDYKNSVLRLVKTEASVHAHHRFIGGTEHHLNRLCGRVTCHFRRIGGRPHFPVRVLRQPSNLAIRIGRLGNVFGSEGRGVDATNQCFHGGRTRHSSAG